MPLDFTHPHEFSCFGTLHPDHLVAWSFGDPHVEWELTGLFSGPGAYTTVPLDAETDIHYHPGDKGAPNTMAQHLATRYGFDGLDVRGPVHFTGPSGETDRALGIAPDAFDILYGRVKDICADLGVRTWCKLHPGDTVSVRYTDLERGDTYWFLNTPHRFQGLRDFPADSKTLEFIPDARVLVCDDEFTVTAYGTYQCRADRPRRVLAAHRQPAPQRLPRPLPGPAPGEGLPSRRLARTAGPRTPHRRNDAHHPSGLRGRPRSRPGPGPGPDPNPHRHPRRHGPARRLPGAAPRPPLRRTPPRQPPHRRRRHAVRLRRRGHPPPAPNCARPGAAPTRATLRPCSRSSATSTASAPRSSGSPTLPRSRPTHTRTRPPCCASWSTPTRPSPRATTRK